MAFVHEIEHFLAFWFITQLPLWAPDLLPQVSHKVQHINPFCCLELWILTPSSHICALCYHACGDSFKPGYQLSAKTVAMIMQYVLNCRTATPLCPLKISDHSKVLYVIKNTTRNFNQHLSTCLKFLPLIYKMGINLVLILRAIVR